MDLNKVYTVTITVFHRPWVCNHMQKMLFVVDGMLESQLLNKLVNNSALNDVCVLVYC